VGGPGRTDHATAARPGDAAAVRLQDRDLARRAALLRFSTVAVNIGRGPFQITAIAFKWVDITGLPGSANP
jgi:hypothetical protein